MWTARIFFTIVFSGIGFMLWFLTGLVREHLAHSARMGRIAPAPVKHRTLKLETEGSLIQREQDAVTVRLVSRFNASQAAR